MHHTAKRQQPAQIDADASQHHRADDPALRHRPLLARRGALEIDPARLRIFNSDDARSINQALIIDLPPSIAVEGRQCVNTPAGRANQRRQVEGMQHFSSLTNAEWRVQDRRRSAGSDCAYAESAVASMNGRCPAPCST